MLNQHTMRQFWRFGIAGGVGFVVDVIVLYLAVGGCSGGYRGIVASFFCATFATWQVNRNFAFAAATSMSVWAEWWRYVLAVLGGGLVNYLVFSLVVATLPPSPLLPLISVAAGSIGGMVVNFVSTKLLVFRQ
jgi:putative flippase GtrA